MNCGSNKQPQCWTFQARTKSSALKHRVNAPSKKSKKRDKEPSLSDQVLMAQLTWLQLKTARMQKETAEKGVQFDGALDLFDC